MNATKTQRGYRITLPPAPEKCEKCGSKLDGNPFGPFAAVAIPTMNGLTGKWTCGPCADEDRGVNVAYSETYRQLIRTYRECRGIIQ